MKIRHVLHVSDKQRDLIASTLDQSANSRLATREEIRSITDKLLTDYINNLEVVTIRKGPGRPHN